METLGITSGLSSGVRSTFTPDSSCGTVLFVDPNSQENSIAASFRTRRKPVIQDMAEESINLVLSSQVASRFVSSSDLESARIKREEEWKAAYERLGQEPPPMPKEEYDGRSLYEKLKETKDKKQMAFEEKLKFKNQFRALDDEEVAFLDDAAEEKRAEAIAKEAEIQKEMERFKKAIAHRTGEAPLISPIRLVASGEDLNEKPVVASSSKIVSSNTTTTTMIPKKTRKSKDFQRSFLAGAIRPKSTNDEGPSTTKKRKTCNPNKTSDKSSAQNSIDPPPTAQKLSEAQDNCSPESKASVKQP